MTSVYAAIGRFSVRFRWAVLAVWLAAVVLAGVFLPTLASVTKANNTSFLPSKVPSEQAAVLAAPFQRANLTGVDVVASSGRPLTSADVASLTALAVRLRAVPEVVAVKDLGRSPDGQADQLLTLARVARGQDQAARTLVTGLHGVIARSALPAGLQVHLAGVIADQVANAAGNNHGSQVQLLSILFIVVLLGAVFRSVLAPLLTLAPAVLVVQLAGPVIAESTKAGLQVSTLSQLMLIVLVLGAGTDYGLFLVFRVRENLRAGTEPRRAVVDAVARVGESITFSAGTVIAALLSLLLASFGIYQSLGAPLAIGIALMLLAGLTLQPALLAIFGRAAFWPSRVRAGQPVARGWGRVATRVVGAPGRTLAVGLVIFGALAVASLGNKPSGFANALSAPSGTDAAAGDAALAAHFPKAAANPTNLLFRLARPVWSDPAALRRATAELSASPLFTSVEGGANPNGAPLGLRALLALHRRLGPAAALPPLPPAGSPVPSRAYQIYRASAQYVSPDGRTLQFAASLVAGDPSTTAALDAVPSIRAETGRVARSIGATASGVGGEAPGLYDVAHLSDSDLLHVVPVAIGVIAVLLALVMRSLVAPLYLIASVALSYLAALGLAVVIFMYLGHATGLTFILPFLMFLFLLALGEDYNILVMTRIREEAARMPLREAVATAIAATGSTVTSAGLVLAGTFGVFAIAGSRGAGGSQILDVGTGLALGVLMDTFLVRTLLVPSTAALLGRWNWWPSRAFRESPGHPAGAGGPERTQLASGSAARSDR